MYRRINRERPPIPFTHQWLLEGHIIYFRAWDHVSGEDLTEMNRVGQQYLAAANGNQVCLVMHDEDVVGIPGGTIQQHHELMVDFLKDPRITQTVGVGRANPVTRFLQVMANHAFGINTKRVNTMEDAITYLQHLNPDLPPITLPDTH